jgi:exonuclease SbcC
MNPRRVRAENYRSYELLDLALPAGCFAITGVNGAGKTSILQLVDLCLFGGRDLSRYMNRLRGEVMVIELELEHRGDRYRIRRTYNPAGRGKTTLDFEQLVIDGDVGEVNQHWVPLTEGNARETQARIDETFGLSRETFRASAYLAQGDSAAFTEADPGERKRILAEVLGLGLWDGMAELARRDRAGAQEQLSQLRATEALVAELSEALRVAERQHVEAAQQHGEVEARIGGLRDEMAAAQAAREQARAVEGERIAATSAVFTAGQQLAAAQARHETLVKQVEAAEGALHLVTTAKGEAALAEGLQERVTLQTVDQERWRECEAKRVELTRRGQEQSRRVEELNARAVELEAESGRLRLDTARCGSCGQLLTTPESREQAQRQLAEQMRTLARELEEAMALVSQTGEEIAALPTEVPIVDERLVEQLRLAREAQLIVAQEPALQRQLAERREELVEAAAQLAGCMEALSAAQAALAVLPEGQPLRELQEAQRAAQQAWQDADRHLATARDAMVRAAGRRDELADRVAACGDPATQAEETAVALGRIDQLVEAYGRNGVPALIIETAALPHLEAEANRILADLGTSMVVTLRTQRALKSGPGMRETLDIVVSQNGAEALYEDFSGGERTRLNIALRVALARLLAHRRGAEVRMLIVDEPEFLDEAGTEALAGVLHGLTGDFERVALVSHMVGLRDAFDTVIEVERDEAGPSRIVT